MNHGRVTKGRYTTLHGRDAQNWMLNMSIANCHTLSQAHEMVLHSTGDIREYLISGLTRYGFKFSKTFYKKLAKKDKEREVQAEKDRIEYRNRVWRSSPEKEAKRLTAHTCSVCGERIAKGDTYVLAKAGLLNKERAAHVRCIPKP